MLKSKRLSFVENGLHFELGITDDNELRLYHLGVEPFDENCIGDNEDENSRYRLVEANINGFDRPHERHGAGFTVTNLGVLLRYEKHEIIANDKGNLYKFYLVAKEQGLRAVVSYQFFTGLKCVRVTSAIENYGDKTYTLDYLSSFVLNGLLHGNIRDFAHNMHLRVAHNSWCRELQWREYSFDDLGFLPSRRDLQRSSKILSYSNTGAWSSKEYLPMGFVENLERKNALLFEIEHNGSWHFEIGDQAHSLYLQIAGPTEQYGHFFTELKPYSVFESVPCALTFVSYDKDVVSAPQSLAMEHLVSVLHNSSDVATIRQAAFDACVGEMNLYRRRIRRVNTDNQKLPVICNDYMNCLMGDPTTQKLLPLIDKAAEAGCEYFCIDAGWYADGYWWDGVGQWLPSQARFKEGIKYVLDYIRSKHMVPGLWLEIEVMGIKSPKLSETDDSWFFMRHGSRVFDRSRYQLDFTCKAVREHASSVIERLVNEYGVGYIKMDYNIEPGIGTTQYTKSAGEGLLKHNRAYLQWLKETFAKYPELVIENCGSGGLRMDYAMLSQCSIQSTSDQEDYLNYASIATNAPTAVNMEQAAIWAYPMVKDNIDAVRFNEVSAMLLRIHQSGHLAKMDEDKFLEIQKAISVYKDIRGYINTAVPYWPLGLSKFDDEFSALALKVDKNISNVDSLISIWHRKGESDNVTLNLPHLKGKEIKVKTLYGESAEITWCKEKATLCVKLKELTASTLMLAL